MGGKPLRGTSADKRLKGNKSSGGGAKGPKPAFPGARPPFKPGKGK